MLKIFVIFLVSSCTNFDWDPKPFVGDSTNQQIINEHGETVQCSQPDFDFFTCFDPDNIAELKSAIDRVNNKSTRKQLQDVFKKVFPEK